MEDKPVEKPRLSFKDEAEKQRYLKKLRDQIAAWQNRAWMAHSQGMPDLVQRALDQKHKSQTELAEAEGVDPPEPDSPDSMFGSPKTPPNPPPTQPAGVPRRPKPDAGGTDVSLSLPEPDDEPENLADA